MSASRTGAIVFQLVIQDLGIADTTM